MKKQKKQFRMPTAFTVLILLTIVVAIITQFIPAITPATAADVIMAPIDGVLPARWALPCSCSFWAAFWVW